MKKYSVTVREHEEYGDLGLVVDNNRDYFEPGITGVLAAHDIIEHTVKPHYNGIIDELMALGAILAGRIEYGYCNEFGRNLDLSDLTSDISSLAMSCMWEDADFCPEPCNSRLNDADKMQEIRKTVKDGLIEAIEEVTEYEGKEMYKFLYETYNIDHIVGWICKGYQQFKKRFAHIPDYQVMHIFGKITKVCDKFISHAFEGQEAILCIDYSSGLVSIKEKYDEYDY